MPLGPSGVVSIEDCAPIARGFTIGQMRKISLWMALLAAGCGSSVSPDKACTDLAAAFCTEVSNCAAPLITLGYGDVATCQTRLKLSCLPSLMAPSTSATPDKLDSCAMAVDGAMCDA